MYQSLLSVQSPSITLTTSGTINTASTPIALSPGNVIKLEGKSTNTDTIVVNVTVSPGSAATALSSTPTYQQPLQPGAIVDYSMPFVDNQPNAATQLYISIISATASQVVYVTVANGGV